MAGAGAEEAEGGFGAKQVFEWAMFLLIGTFALSCVEQFAQAQQRFYDEQTLEAAGVRTQATNRCVRLMGLF